MALLKTNLWHSVSVALYLTFSRSSFIIGNIGGRGMEKTGKVRQKEIREYTLFYCSRVSWCSSRAHIYIYIRSGALILRKDSRGLIFLVFLSSRVATIQSQASIAWVQGRMWLAKLCRVTNLSYSLKWIKPTDALNSNFIGITILHVSGSLSAHHREFLAM